MSMGNRHKAVASVRFGSHDEFSGLFAAIPWASCHNAVPLNLEANSSAQSLSFDSSGSWFLKMSATVLDPQHSSIREKYNG